MKHELPPLPYDLAALEPHMSKETLEYHYGKHHKAYVDKTNQLIQGTKFEESPLEYIVKHADKGTLFNQAAQAWNHAFFWKCLGPDRGGRPDAGLLQAIEKAFGGFDAFQKTFGEKAAGLFGSGWVWLVKNPDGGVDVVQTANGDTPLTGDSVPLIACDVWEHAYYIDHRNDRAKYVKAYWDLANWDFAAENFEKARGAAHSAQRGAQSPADRHARH